jgi:hypothetical protein
MIEKKLQNVLNALERHYPYESESGIIKLSLGDFAEAIQTLNSIILKNQCARSHPHEDMNELCELKTEIARLNNKLAQAKQEPVAWVGINEKWGMAKMVASEYKKDGYKPVYLHPPQREWQGLTDEEVQSEVARVLATLTQDIWPIALSRAIEAKLREKNT